MWGAVELQSNPSDDRSVGPAIALFTAPRENASDNYREKVLLGVLELSPSGNVTLEQFTNDFVSAYNNLSDSITILESNSTTLAGQPAHRIVFTEEALGQMLKKAQVWTISDNKAYVPSLLKI